VLACELSDSGSLYRVLPLLKAQDFSQDSHRRIQHAIAELAEAGKPVDELTVTDALLAKGQLASVGGVAYLSSLASNLNTGLASANLEHYAELIVDKSRRRHSRRSHGNRDVGGRASSRSRRRSRCARSEVVRRVGDYPGARG